MGDDIKRINCVKDGCGTFPMDRALYERLRRSGETWTCPAGHAQHFTESVESKLRSKLEDAREQIAHLEGKLEAAEAQIESYDDTIYDYVDDLHEERDRRKHLESMVLAEHNGVVEVGPGEFKWSCPCGGRGHKAFESPDQARRAMADHHERTQCVGTQGIGRVLVP